MQTFACGLAAHRLKHIVQTFAFGLAAHRLKHFVQIEVKSMRTNFDVIWASSMLAVVTTLCQDCHELLGKRQSMHHLCCPLPLRHCPAYCVLIIVSILVFNGHPSILHCTFHL